LDPDPDVEDVGVEEPPQSKIGRTTAMSVVGLVSRSLAAARNFIGDEGRSFGFGDQGR